jgi:hypothetical protein
MDSSFVIPFVGKTEGYATKIGVTTDYEESHGHVGGFERTSKSTFEYSFTFGYDLSTSSDPTIAGHASDIIMGGGLNIVLLEALKGIFLFLLPVIF